MTIVRITGDGYLRKLDSGNVRAVDADGVAESAISGSVSLAFGVSLQTTPGGMSASTSLAFGVSGVLSGLAALQGSVSLATTVSGVLIGKSAVSGSTSLSFYLTGNLVNGAAKNISSFAVTMIGIVSASDTVAWAGSANARNKVFWLPPANTPITLDGRTMNPVWYRAMQEVFDNRLGGLAAKTLPQVAAKQDQANDYLASAQTNIVGLVEQVNAVTSTVNTQTDVSKANNLAGSSQLSRLPSYKLAQIGMLQ